MANFKAPTVGSIVTVTTRHRDAYYLAEKEFKDTVYANVGVLRPFPWMTPNEFCIPSNGDPHIDVRVINLDSVIDLQIHGEQGELNKDMSINYVDVPGTDGTVYKVTVFGGVARSCTCLGYQYRKQCRHLRLAMGETPINPRRTTLKKRKPAMKPVAAYVDGKGNETVLTPSTTTKADLVRNLIRAHKAKMTAETVTDMVVTKLGFSRSLAATYVKNNWNKV